MFELIKTNEKYRNASLIGILLIAAIFMGTMSLASLNKKATKGYLVNKLETERQELVQDGEINDMLILRARSLESIEQSDRVARMVKAKPDEFVYVNPITVVASR